MRPGAVSNQTNDDFEILGQVYLDPLLEKRSFFWIGIYERLADAAVRRIFRGPIPPCHSFAFGAGNVGMVAEKGIRKTIPDVTSDPQYSQCFIQTQSEWVEPVRYGDQIVGVIDIEEDRKNAFGQAEEKMAFDLAAQVAPLFAWTDTPWSTRLEVLKKLSDLKRRFKVFDWVGIYRVSSKISDTLELSAYIGAPTEHIRIPISKGICGAAVREERTLNIPNVKSDPRFIACSTTTESELVVPIRNSSGKVIAEIDIDSDQPNAFSDIQTASVEACAEQIGRLLEFGS